jgi:hypothetical protein
MRDEGGHSQWKGLLRWQLKKGMILITPLLEGVKPPNNMVDLFFPMLHD